MSDPKNTARTPAPTQMAGINTASQSMQTPLIDQHVRQQALNTAHSFIVQAPAGSGKTELLTRRFLTLLARVNAPEQVLAITFTRKAASEMRHRLIEAISTPISDTDHTIKIDPDGGDDAPKQTTDPEKASLIKAIQAHSEAMGWRLAQYPERLNIMTIDALCLQCVRRQPHLSSDVNTNAIHQDPQALYLKAAHELCLHAHETPELEAPLSTILGHCDNNWDYCARLFAQLLAKRDAWLPHIAHRDHDVLKDALESALHTVISETLEIIPPLFSATLIDQDMLKGIVEL